TPLPLMARLDRFLNYPAYCPHGSAIPHMDGQTDQIPMQKLNCLPVGEASHIRKVTEERELLDYLQARGVTIGSPVRIIEAAPYEGAFTLELEGRQVQISYKAACQIYVDKAAPMEHGDTEG
ncbi:MAG TPA: Cro/Cl family transcriptional regulator, partial [Clostridiales bacterium]|nr:Cro/Cl family transcriptional regulator [Clostridiales bacterium]